MTYVRLGHNQCPKKLNTEKIYQGVVAGTFYNTRGGSANYLCLPDDPNYGDINTKPSIPHTSLLSGTEYEIPIKGVHDHGAPCALCYDKADSTEFMIPASTTCPEGWTRNYYGYLMGSLNSGDRSPKDYICVDKDQISSRGSTGNQNGALLYHVRANCHTGIHCPPYDTNKALTCAVCSK